MNDFRGLLKLGLRLPILLLLIGLLWSPAMVAAKEKVENTSTEKNPIIGTWKITESKTPKNVEYSGKVTFTPSGEAVRFLWDTSLGKLVGIGFFKDNHFFGAFGSMDRYGVELFKIREDGNLEGIWTFMGGQGAFGRETTNNGTPGKLEGIYKFSGSNQGATVFYEGTLSVQLKGAVYYLEWDVNNEKFPGVALRTGDWLICGFGRKPPKKGFGTIYYKFDGDTAEGQLTFDGKQTFVSEKLGRSTGNTDKETLPKNAEKKSE